MPQKGCLWHETPEPESQKPQIIWKSPSPCETFFIHSRDNKSFAPALIDNQDSVLHSRRVGKRWPSQPKFNSSKFKKWAKIKSHEVGFVEAKLGYATVVLLHWQIVAITITTWVISTAWAICFAAKSEPILQIALFLNFTPERQSYSHDSKCVTHFSNIISWVSQLFEFLHFRI